MPASSACSILLSSSNESMLGSSRTSSPSQPLEFPCPESNVDITSYTVLNINSSSKNTIGNQSSQPSVADKSRLKLLKRSTEPEIELLLRSISLTTLREWCEEVLVKPIGPLNHKASFGAPLLSTTFWPYYSKFATMNITVPCAAAPEIGSRSTAADGCLYDLQQTRFPMDLLQKLLKVKHVNRSAVTSVARSTAVDQRKSILKVGD